ncbi:hypothetical protein [Methylomonas koyamae]|uniref:hypothetical protein n=1 Tax=Methylomonas koyamae TaxID=702114 RepID=UPI0006D0CF72|nr:hypothetical protein [Methylomonas koyamae]
MQIAQRQAAGKLLVEPVIQNGVRVLGINVEAGLAAGVVAVAEAAAAADRNAERADVTAVSATVTFFSQSSRLLADLLVSSQSFMR